MSYKDKIQTQVFSHNKMAPKKAIKMLAPKIIQEPVKDVKPVKVMKEPVKELIKEPVKESVKEIKSDKDDDKDNYDDFKEIEKIPLKKGDAFEDVPTNEQCDWSDIATIPKEVKKEEKVKVYSSFEDMDLKEKILKGVYAYGYEKPSAIQQRAIVPIMQEYDVIGQAQSGTGKTATFSIGALERIDMKLAKCQILILAHTRELAMQTAKVALDLGSVLGVKVNVCIGGTDIDKSIKELRDGCHIVVGSPGRVHDMIRRKEIQAEHIKLLILDEADALLSDEFRGQIEDILYELPETAQKCIFSATLPQHVVDLAKAFMKEPIMKILVKTEELTLEGIKQYYINVERDLYKFETLCDLYNNLMITQAIIYVNERNRVETLRNKLQSRGHTVSCIHAGLGQDERVEIMKEFRCGKTRILLTTDLLSRGIDVQQVSLVLNYDLPKSRECYIHRIGRSGRFGRKGVAINFATTKDEYKLIELEKFYNTQICTLPMDLSELT